MTVRGPVAPTTRAAFTSITPALSGIRARVLEVIEAAGADGLIGDEVRARLLAAGMKDGSLNTRYSELEKAGLIFRNGDTRLAATGRQQLVMRSMRYATEVEPITGKGKRRRSPFLSGLMWAAKVVLEAGEYEAAKKALRSEIVKAAARAKRGP